MTKSFSDDFFQTRSRNLDSPYTSSCRRVLDVFGSENGIYFLRVLALFYLLQRKSERASDRLLPPALRHLGCKCWCHSFPLGLTLAVCFLSKKIKAEEAIGKEGWKGKAEARTGKKCDEFHKHRQTHKHMRCTTYIFTLSLTFDDSGYYKSLESMKAESQSVRRRTHSNGEFSLHK